MNPIGLAIAAEPSAHPAPPGHPERYERLAAAIAALDTPQLKAITQPLKAREYDPALLSPIHSRAYITQLATAVPPGEQHDADTFQSAGSFEASCRMTWALLSAVDAAFGEGPVTSFILGRPPGHHACRERPMGFCLVNHVAVAARYALDSHHAGRVAIVDFDVHHGNGTQELFYDRSQVLYISSHQYPFYPGTGGRDETGTAEGDGYTVNFPLPAGTDDRTFLEIYEHEVARSLKQYRPDLILVSAGFDAHIADPLGGLSITGGGFKRVGEILKSLADEVCDGRLISILEGGYDAEANKESVCNYIEGLA